MLKKLFNKFLSKNIAAKRAPESAPILKESFMRALAERRQIDPLVGVKLGGKEIFQQLINALKSERGVHIETLLAILASVAGYACQASIRAEFSLRGKVPPFVVMSTKNQGDYYYGDLLNAPLIANQYSIFGLSAGIVQSLGGDHLIDLQEIFSYVAKNLGTDKFGIPRLAEGNFLSDTPINFVKAFWPVLMPIAKEYCIHPAEWPILFGIAVQEAICLGKESITPSRALSLVMECAIPMSKIEMGDLWRV